MAEVFHVQIVTPGRTFYDGKAAMVELATSEGDIGILRSHIPLTAIVIPGILKLHENGRVKTAALMSGFLEILPEKVTILTDAAEWPEEIDENRAKAAGERARQRMTDQEENVDLRRAEAAFMRSMVRLSFNKRQ